MTAPHETDRFAKAATYTIEITFTTAGGARSQTAHRRARVAAERIAGAAARLAHVIDANSVVGLRSPSGQLLVPRPVHAANAKTERTTHLDRETLDRSPDNETDVLTAVSQQVSEVKP